MFGRKKKQKDAGDAQGVEEKGTPEGSPAEDAVAVGTDGAVSAAGAKSERASGPLDAAEAGDDVTGFADLGSLRIPIVEGMNLNLEVEQQAQQVVSVAIELEGSRVQLQAFAAPKSEGLWPGISAQIDQSVTAQGGRTDRRDGRFGPEILARVPATGPDGSQGVMIARFVGVDGPRWFLRAVFGGPAAINDEAAAALEELLGRVVVDRGQTPMAPTELLPLRVPSSDPIPAAPGAAAQAGAGDEPGGTATPDAADAAAAGASAGDADGAGRERRPERGPEITEIG